MYCLDMILRGTFVIKVFLTNEILRYITEIEINRFIVSETSISYAIANKLRKNSKKRSSYASAKIEGESLE